MKNNKFYDKKVEYGPVIYNNSLFCSLDTIWYKAMVFAPWKLHFIIRLRHQLIFHVDEI